MEPKAEHIVQNVGAIAEAISIYYNSMARQVPKDVALELTKHFMSLTISRRPMAMTLDPKLMARTAEDVKKHLKEYLQKKQEQPAEQPSGEGGMDATQKPGTPGPSQEPPEEPDLSGHADQ